MRSRTTRILWPCLRCATISFAYIRRCGTYWKLGKWPVTDAVANNELKTAASEVSAGVPTRYGGPQSPARGQPFQAAQHESRPPFRFFGIIEPQIWQAAQ